MCLLYTCFIWCGRPLSYNFQACPGAQHVQPMDISRAPVLFLESLCMRWQLTFAQASIGFVIGLLQVPSLYWSTIYFALEPHDIYKMWIRGSTGHSFLIHVASNFQFTWNRHATDNTVIREPRALPCVGVNQMRLLGCFTGIFHQVEMSEVRLWWQMGHLPELENSPLCITTHSHIEWII